MSLFPESPQMLLEYARYVYKREVGFSNILNNYYYVLSHYSISNTVNATLAKLRELDHFMFNDLLTNPDLADGFSSFSEKYFTDFLENSDKVPPLPGSTSLRDTVSNLVAISNSIKSDITEILDSTNEDPVDSFIDRLTSYIATTYGNLYRLKRSLIVSLLLSECRHVKDYKSVAKILIYNENIDVEKYLHHVLSSWKHARKDILNEHVSEQVLSPNNFNFLDIDNLIRSILFNLTFFPKRPRIEAFKKGYEFQFRCYVLSNTILCIMPALISGLEDSISRTASHKLIWGNFYIFTQLNSLLTSITYINYPNTTKFFHKMYSSFQIKDAHSLEDSLAIEACTLAVKKWEGGDTACHDEMCTYLLNFKQEGKQIYKNLSKNSLLEKLNRISKPYKRSWGKPGAKRE